MEELTRPYREDPRYYPGLYIQKLDKLFGGPNKKGLLSEFDKRSCTLIRPLRKARFPEGTPVIYHCYKDIKQLCKLKPQLVHLKIPEGAKSWGAYQIWLTKRGAEMAEKLNAWQKENQTKPKTDPKKRKETLALNLPEPKDFDNMVDQPIEEETTYLTTQPEPESETVNSPERLDDILALEKSGKIFISGVQNYLNEYKNQVSCQYKLDLSQAKKEFVEKHTSELLMAKKVIVELGSFLGPLCNNDLPYGELIEKVQDVKRAHAAAITLLKGTNKQM